MVKKSYLATLVLFGVMSLQISRECLADSSGNIEQTKEKICLLINEGRYAEANTATEQLSSAVYDSQSLSEAQYSIGVKYESASRYGDATRLFQQVIQNSPAGPRVDKARLGVSRAEAMTLITSQKYEQAGEAFERTVNDFTGNPELPEALYWITERFERANRFEDANRNYQRIMRDYPSSPWAEKARFATSKADVMTLIVSQKYDQAGVALDKFASDFNGNPDLPEAIYWIAERYQRSEKFEDAKRNFQKIKKDYPGSVWAAKAKLNYARTEALSLIASQDYKRANRVIDKMAADFDGKADLPGVIYWIMERYDRIGRFEDAGRGFNIIIQKYPSSPYVSRAKLRLAKAGVVSLIKSQDYNQADAAFNKMVSDFNTHSDLLFAVMGVGEEYYSQRKTAGSLEKAIQAFKVITEQLPVCEMAPETCCWLGDCFTELGQYMEGIEYYRQSCDGFPQFATVAGIDYTYRWRSMFMIGQNFQKMIQAGAISKTEGEPLIIEAYERLVREYPNCEVDKDVWRELGHLYAGSSRWQDTIRCFEAYLKLVPMVRCSPEVFYKLAKAYDGVGNSSSAQNNYKLFVKLAVPNDPRRKEVRSRLAEMTQAN